MNEWDPWPDFLLVDSGLGIDTRQKRLEQRNRSVLRGRLTGGSLLRSHRLAKCNDKKKNIRYNVLASNPIKRMKHIVDDLIDLGLNITDG